MKNYLVDSSKVSRSVSPVKPMINDTNITQNNNDKVLSKEEKGRLSSVEMLERLASQVGQQVANRSREASKTNLNILVRDTS
jgi:hypothetical protein